MTSEIKQNNILQLYLKLQHFKQVLKNRVWFIVITTFLFSCVGVTISLLSKTQYSAKSTLILEDNKGFRGLDALTNLASQFGMGQGVSVAEDKIVKIFYSRAVTERVLFSTNKKKDSTCLIINELIRTQYQGNKLIEGVYFKSLDNLSREQLRALKGIHNYFSLKNLNVQVTPEGLINVNVILNDEDLAVAMNTKIVQEIESFYMGGAVAKNRRSFTLISNKLDSLDDALKVAEENYIQYSDANHNSVSARGIVNEMHLRREIEVLNVMRLEAVKSLEMNKMSSQFSNSFLRVIDTAKLPADIQKKGLIKYFLIFTILGLFLSVFYVYFSSLIKELSQQSKGIS
ncbi:MAG: Wzz/FepE/Etk N-terminal domain-containing protein [Flavobacteriales bacterium]